MKFRVYSTGHAGVKEIDGTGVTDMSSLLTRLEKEGISTNGMKILNSKEKRAVDSNSHFDDSLDENLTLILSPNKNSAGNV